MKLKFATSRSMKPGDYEELQEELKVVEDTLSRLDGGHWAQHRHRRWEYALLLRALSNAGMLSGNGRRCIDIGCSVGITSALMLRLGWQPYMTDVWIGQDESWRNFQMAQMAKSARMWAPPNEPAIWGMHHEDVHDGGHFQEFPLVLCVSTLEHIPEGNHAFDCMLDMVAPGGLAFFTMDFAEDGLVDNFQYKELRAQIFDCPKMLDLADRARDKGFNVFAREEGSVSIDYRWEGPMVNDYTFGSLVLQRKSART